MNKLEDLFRNSPWVKYSNPDNVKNLSSTPLTLDQLVVLGYGLSFSLPPSNEDILDFLTNYSKFEYFNSQHNGFLPQDFATLKGFILNSLYKELNDGKKIPKRLHQAIIYLKQNDSLIICKADKGGKVVVLDKWTYKEKMEELLQDENTYQTINNDPLKKWQHSFNKQLKQILKDFPDLETRFRAFMPRLPRMYGLPKLHKENIPMRPIVSTNNSIEYKLSSWISKILSACTNKICNTTVINSLDFKEKIQRINHDHKIIASFDIKSLFTNIPIDECINLLSHELHNLNIDIPIPIDVFLKLLKLAVTNCYFSFNDRFYIQKTGLPMGSPLSPILANIFLEFYERDKLSSVLDFDRNTWLRYVDDVFVILPNTTNIPQLIEQINSLHPSIQFTFEQEQNLSLPFLDIHVIKNQNNHRFNFKVYRKPTNSNSYIHYFSHHSNQIKLGTITNIFLRAYAICCPEFLQDEILFIKNVFNSLAYPSHLIHRAHMNARKSFYRVNNNNNSNKDFSKVLILPFDSNIAPVKHILKDKNIKVINRSSNTVRSQFSFKMHPPTDKNTNVIYYVPCGSCTSGYIGESINLDKRLYSHNYDRTNFNTNNSIVNHIASKNHNVNLKNTIVLHNENDTNKRKLIESVLICNNENFNNQKCNYNLDVISNHLVYNKIPIFSKLTNKIKDAHS